MATRDEYSDVLETVFGEIEAKLLWLRNEASDDCSTDNEGEEAMLRTIDQLLCSVVHIAGDIEEGDVLMNQLTGSRPYTLAKQNCCFSKLFGYHSCVTVLPTLIQRMLCL